MGSVICVEFDVNPGGEGQMSPRMVETLQSAVDATASAYAENADLNVEEWLRTELGLWGISVSDDDWLADQADVIRTRQPIPAGEPSQTANADDGDV